VTEQEWWNVKGEPEPVDLDQDGVTDWTVAESNAGSVEFMDMGDGGQTVSLDADGDGDYEAVGSDFDGDGEPEIVQSDADGDGSLESLDYPGGLQ
jgi:hypothetical protein